MAVWQDIRYGLRILAGNPAFTIAVVVILALGIGASTAIFTVVNGVLLRPLPYAEPERIVMMWQLDPEGARYPVSDLTFEEWHAQSGAFQAMAQYKSGMTAVMGGSEPVRANVAMVSRDFFAACGMSPCLGRVWLDEGEQGDGEPAVVVSYGFWKRYLGGAADLTATSLRCDGRIFSVVGVMSPQFRFPKDAELWVPRELYPRDMYRSAHNWNVVGRLRDGVTLRQAQSEMTTIAKRQRQQHGQEDAQLADVGMASLHEQMTRHVRPALLVLLGAASFLLAVACANAANLLLAHAVTRQKELDIRAALGATRGRLVRQLLTESLVLTFLAAAAGILLAHGAVKLLLRYEPGKLPRTEQIAIDVRVVLFAVSVSVITASLLGLSGAMRTTGHRLNGGFLHGCRTQTGTGGSETIRSALVISQVALTLVLLAGAALLGRSFWLLSRTDLGFRTKGVLVMTLSHPELEDKAAAARLAPFHEQLLERLQAIPGVLRVGGVHLFPLSQSGFSGGFLILRPGDEVNSFEDFARLAKNPDQLGHAEFRVASDGYFQAMDIPLLRGRMFDQGDGPDTPHVALISESLARQKWPNSDPIGQRIQFGNMDGDLRPFTVVGIVGDIRGEGADAGAWPIFYGCYRQRPGVTSSFSIALRTAAEPAGFIPVVRRTLRDLNPEVPAQFHTVSGMLSDSLADRRFNLLLLSCFGSAALLLALVGLYGVMSYSVRRRTQEIGIRVAMGARPCDIWRLVLGRSSLMILCGVAIGLVATLALSRVLRSMLFGIGPTDPITLVAAVVTITAAALIACYLPARRAVRIDPMLALRHE